MKQFIIDHEPDSNADAIMRSLEQLNLTNTSTLLPSNPKSGATSATTSIPPSCAHSLASFETPETSDDSSDEDLPPTFVARQTKDRGLVLFTTRRISAGALIFSESPLISLPRHLENDYDAVESAFQSLSKADRKSYLALFDAQKSRMSRVASIYYSNCYNKEGFTSSSTKNEAEDEGGSCIGALSSRINHSCVPNVSFSYRPPSAEHPKAQMRFHAIRAIPAGKEILNCYEKNIFLTRKERAGRLVMYYGFKCGCEACLPRSEFWEKSDGRRVTMGKLVKASKQVEKEWEVLVKDRDSDGDAGEEKKAKEVYERAIENLTKLEGLLVKEGLAYTPLANVYRSLARWSERTARVGDVKKWKRKELQVCMTCLGADSGRSERLKQELEEMELARDSDLMIENMENGVSTNGMRIRC